MVIALAVTYVAVAFVVTSFMEVALAEVEDEPAKTDFCALAGLLWPVTTVLLLVTPDDD